MASVNLCDKFSRQTQDDPCGACIASPCYCVGFVLQLPILLCTPFFSICSEEKRLEASLQEEYERKKKAEDEAKNLDGQKSKRIIKGTPLLF